MKDFSLLVKPASFRCNLHCSYCFYLKKEEIYGNPPLMSEEILERMISSFLSLKMQNYAFGWQGGEPTLMGLDFFRKVCFFQEKYGRRGLSVSNGLQTNGILIDDKWAKHLQKYNFLAGISIDGPAEIHDKRRRSISGGGSHAAVMCGLEALKRNHVEHNVLTLVSESNASSPLLVYNYLKKLGVNYHQYIECVEFDADGCILPFSVGSAQWGEFLCAIFDEWFKCDTMKVSVRLFDSILSKLVDSQANVCVMRRDCRSYFVVEHNGDVYPCDFYVNPEFKLGNVTTDSWKRMQESELYRRFGARKHEWNPLCNSCRHLDLCMGSCPKNRHPNGNSPSGMSAVCEGWKIFFSHCRPRLEELAFRIRKEREEAFRLHKNASEANTASSPSAIKPGRNDRCPCGSGRKYKHCCATYRH